MTFTKTYAISRMEKGASLVGSIFGPALAIFGMSLFLMSYAATHAWQMDASQMGYFWQSVGEYPYFVQAIWPALTSFWQTSALTLVMLVLGLGGAYLTFSDFKRRKWVRGAFRLALSMLAVAFVIFAMSSSVVLAASPTSGPIGQSVDTGYGTSCSASFCVFTNTVSGTQYYYAMVGLGYSSGSSCALTAGCQVGQVAYGGPGNAGGATGTDFGSLMNKAISVMVNGGSIVISPGTYKAATTINITNAQIEISSTQPNLPLSSTQLQVATDIPFISVQSSYTTLRGLYFFGLQNANSSMIVIPASQTVAISELRIDYCWFAGAGTPTGYAIDASATRPSKTDNSYVLNSHFDNIQGIQAAYFTDLTVEGNYFNDRGALFDNSGGGASIKSNIFNGNTPIPETSYAVVLGNAGVFSIEGNLFTDLPQGALYINNLGVAGGATIAGNVFQDIGTSANDTYYAMQIEPGSDGVFSMVITGNIFFKSIQNNEPAADVNIIEFATPNVSHLSITGNYFNNFAGSSAINSFSGMVSASTVVMAGNSGFNPVATSVTAGTSVWTYTNDDGYDEVMQLSTAGGISAEACNGVSGWSITVGTSSCTLPPGGTMVVTWATTAPVYEKVPLFA